MSTLPTFDFSDSFKTAYADFQEKAKAAYEKSTSALGEYNDFAKGNVEAIVESSKILASALQELGSELAAESRKNFEALSTDVKELSASKSPADFLKLQSELLKKHFDQAVAFSSKQSEALLKLSSEVAAPLSNRVSLAVDKIKKAA